MVEAERAARSGKKKKKAAAAKAKKPKSAGKAAPAKGPRGAKKRKDPTACALPALGLRGIAASRLNTPLAMV